MAFIIENAKSERLNRINVGQRVTLCDFTKKQAVFNATLIGWFIGDKPTQAPAKMKDMPENINMQFGSVTNMQGETQDNVTLVSAPGTYGALFLAIVTGEGENTKTIYRRVTAYAALADIEAKKAVTEPEAKEAKAPKGRKGKNKEVKAEEVTEVTA